MEIERKWLLKRIPSRVPSKVLAVSQGYISIDPEVRFRQVVGLNSDDNYITVKGDGLISREEVETKINKSDFLSLASIANKCLIHKIDYFYEIKNYLVRVSDVDDGTFIYAEIEFASEDEAKSFNDSLVRSWFSEDNYIEEITQYNYYKMKNYWNKTRILGEKFPYKSKS